MASAIEVRNLRKVFDGTPALDGVSLTVPAGAVYGLVGPNGCGKSTLVSHLSGVMRPTSGDVLVLGEKVFENPGVKVRIACVPSEPYFIGSESADGMAGFYRVMIPTFDLSRYLGLEKHFEVDHTKPLRKLSRGMRAQAAIWLALSIRADVLLLDEPMDGIDPLARRRMWRLVLEEVAERGLTVLVTSHNLRELEGVCDHLGIMAKGTMREEVDLSQPSDGVAKVQVVLPEGMVPPVGLNVIRQSNEGRVLTLLVRGSAGEVREALAALHPSYLEVLPLSLEERFICELGGDDDGIM
ncbi:ATP-binding cassette domain-containing protein [Olsenella sp. kh2p3]|uniref:ABC transporter ATP-binding protein n=1 Tax=Olsenella sp. kh2p3 TaxID=1797112 RepID=UPI00091271DD|nr:ATP-binding cassette domain-containing protein [Olsenella sp. kh2p3]SFX51597.1 ABC-2 type transport system ATP-binding protein [Olsenella sp. kh2p3]